MPHSRSTTPEPLSSPRQASVPHPPRWWPSWLLTGGFIVALVWLWYVQPHLGGRLAVMRQYRVIATIGVSAIYLCLLFAWAMLFSRLPWKRRLCILAATAFVCGTTALTVRIRGVTGDLVPILAFRWTPETGMAPRAGQSPEIANESEPRATQEPAGSLQLGSILDVDSKRDSHQVPEADVRQIGLLDFPQFLGPERRAIVRGVRLARDWEASPPRLLWRLPVGPGWSAFAVARGYAFTQEQRGEEETVVCRDLLSGRVLWRHTDRARFEAVIAGIGPRATPTVTEDRVYSLGATGILNCLERSTGRRVWNHDVVGEVGARLPEWGKSCSPLVHGKLVIVSAGGREGKSLVAYERTTGALVWAGGDDRSGYSSPTVANLCGREQILILNKGSVVSHDPETGKVLWSFPWPDQEPNVAQPVRLEGDRVFASSGYGVGCKLLQIEGDPQGGLSARLLWETTGLKAKFTNVVAHGGFIYGLDDGILVCLDLANGERRWKEGRYGHGQMLLVEDLLLVTTEKGEVVLVDPAPDTLRELTRFRALDRRTWASPALAGNYLLIRGDEEAACYELPRG